MSESAKRALDRRERASAVKPAVVYDIETTGNPFHGRVLSVAYQEVDAATATVLKYADLDFATERSLEFRDMLADPDRPTVSFTKYDPRFLTLAGWDIAGPLWDAQVLAWVLNENQSLSLAALVRRYCGYEMDKRLRVSAGVVRFKDDSGREFNLAEYDSWPTQVQDRFHDYNQRDTESTTHLWRELRERAGEWWDYFTDEEVPFTRALVDAEVNGLPIDLERTRVLTEELEPERERMLRALLTDGGLPDVFNVNSGPQLAAFMFHKVFELKAAVDLGPDAAACLKSCLDGEHEDCERDPRITQLSAAPPYGDPPVLHIRDLLPDRFEVQKLGRSVVHGRYTLRGRGLRGGEMTDKGDRYSTRSGALHVNLSTATDPWVADLLAYRKVEKALTTYLRKFPKIAVWEGLGGGPATTPRIFGRFNQTGTKTGRLSSSEPNLQNIPSHGDLGQRIRELFVGNLVVGDYSQLEPRLMAHFSGDEFLTDVYRSGKDIYRELASRIFGCKPEDVTDEQRGIGKTLVLAMGYGAGAKKVAEILTINGYPTGVDRAEEYLDILRDIVERFFGWREAIIEKVKRQGYVSTLGGRRRRLKSQFADRKNWKNIGYGERQAVNAVVQGSAGDIVRRVMIGARDVFKDLRLLAQVHDELVWEYLVSPPEWGLAALQKFAETEHAFHLNVPLKFEPFVCENWGQKGTGLVVPEDLLEESTDYAEERDA